MTLLLASVGGGCVSRTQPYLTSPRLEKGLVIVLPGIEGRSAINEDICHSLDSGGVPYAIELYDWTVRLPIFGLVYNQRASGRNHKKASELAERILRYHAAYPGRPVFLVGQSGGGAMAAWTAESLPIDAGVDGIIMLAVSLSPQYMLDNALSKSRGGIISFYSSRDVVLLGLGTTVTGTMDGEHTSSAGRTGFDIPTAGGRPRVYDKLHQVPWNPRMGEAGNSGFHITSGASLFVSEYVAPFIMNRDWNENLVNWVVANAGRETATRPADKPATKSAGKPKPSSTPKPTPKPTPIPEPPPPM